MGGLSHVEIYVSNLDRSVEFWGWLLPELGFEAYQKWEAGRSWRSGDTYIVFVQAEEPYRAETFHRKRPGLNHLAFWAESSAKDSGCRRLCVNVASESCMKTGVPTNSALRIPTPFSLRTRTASRWK